MKYLGIDYGAKRTGIAMSDERGRVAFPHAVLATSRHLADEISALVHKEGIHDIILGSSLDRTGQDNPVMRDIRVLADALRAKGLPVAFEPEHYTSQMASRTQGENAMHDASAAALILQSYLDRRNAPVVDTDPYALPRS